MKYLCLIYSFLDKKRLKKEVFVPKLNYEDARICEGDLNELELLKALKSMQNNKSPGNDGLTRVLRNALKWHKTSFYEFNYVSKKKKRR